MIWEAATRRSAVGITPATDRCRLRACESGALLQCAFNNAQAPRVEVGRCLARVYSGLIMRPKQRAPCSDNGSNSRQPHRHEAAAVGAHGTVPPPFLICGTGTGTGTGTETGKVGLRAREGHGEGKLYAQERSYPALQEPFKS